MQIIVNGVKNGIASLELDEKIFKLTFDQVGAVPINIESNSSKVQSVIT
jgi:hypothetical protein